MLQYTLADCVTFYRTRDPFGGFSNMAGGYPITLGRFSVRTTEHLYQAMRFPDDPVLQQDILAIPSPLLAKRVAYQHLAQTRADWDIIKPDVMLWCLELKLTQHRDRFGDLLLASGQRDIVELSPRDAYWGAKPMANDGQPPHYAIGWNVLGRLLWVVRHRQEIAVIVDPATIVGQISNFRLGGEDAGLLSAAH